MDTLLCRLPWEDGLAGTRTLEMQLTGGDNVEKPTLFISHSSADKDYLRALKDLIDRKTGGTLEIFLSSDGQSIPFGANWVHSIETALDRASVMFVAVSPQAVDSSWIYFEAGYTYSRKIKVIPVGITGLNIERIKPPLSLLQGFNIASYQGLNNLITVINREYNCHFDEDFTPQDYERLKMIGETHSSAMQRYTEIVDYISASLYQTVDATHELTADSKVRLHELLNELGLPFYQVDDSTVVLSGARIGLTKGSKQSVSVQLDLLCATWGIPLIRALFSGLYNSPPARFWFRLYFQPHVKVLTTDFKVSSRLGNAGITIWPERGNLFQFRNLLFTPEEDIWYAGSGRAESRPCLRVVGETLSKDGIPLLSLLDALIEAGVVELGS